MTAHPPSASTQGPQQLQTLAAGEQSLVYTKALDCPLQHLPPRAFDSLLIITFRKPRAVHESLQSVGANMQRVGIISLSPEQVIKPDDHNYTAVVDPGDLTEVSIKYTQALDCFSANSGWVLFEKTSLLEMYHDTPTVKRFIEHVTEVAKGGGHRGVYEVVAGSACSETVQVIERNTQQAVDFRSQPATHR